MDAAPAFDPLVRAPDGFRLPPHNLQIEQRVLGAIMVNNAALVRCRERSLRPEHFYEPSHAGLYEKLRGRIVNGRLADVEALCVGLDRDAKEAMRALAELSSTILPEDAEQDALELIALAQRRRQIELGHTLANAAYDMNVPANQHRDQVRLELEQLAREAPSAKRVFWTLDDIAALEPPEWLIESWLPRRTKILIFGESGAYKTMHVVDMLCRIAHGMPYHGQAVPKSFPIVFIANEDAFGLAVQRLQGWHRKYRVPSGRVIVIPNAIRLDQPEDVERAIGAAREAFGEELPIFAIDTWDRSVGGSTNDTEAVNAALNGLDRLLEHGEATVTISHSPWSDKNRTKGSVTLWANHETRIKAEKEETTGYGLITAVHQKNALAGQKLAFEFEQFGFQHRGVDIDTLIPQRLIGYQPAQPTPQEPMLGARQRIMAHVFEKLSVKHPNGVDAATLRSHFLQELNAEYKSKGKPPLTADAGRAAYNECLRNLKKRGMIEGENPLSPGDKLSGSHRRTGRTDGTAPLWGEPSVPFGSSADSAAAGRTERTGERNAIHSVRSDDAGDLEEKLARLRSRDVPPS